MPHPLVLIAFNSTDIANEISTASEKFVSRNNVFRKLNETKVNYCFA
jgi:hypothetical protein